MNLSMYMLLLLYSLGHGNPAFYMVDVDEPQPAQPQAQQFDMDYSDSYLAEKTMAGNLKRKKNRSSKLVKRVKDMDKIEEVLKQFEDLKNNQDDESNNLSEPAETPPAGGNTIGDDYMSGPENEGHCIMIDENTCIYES